LAQAQATADKPDGFDNFVGWLCHKLGIGTMSVFLVISEEVLLTHIMHHYVFLPTPIGSEIVALSKQGIARFIHKMNILMGRTFISRLLKIKRQRY
jgi:hypothetical protein